MKRALLVIVVVAACKKTAPPPTTTVDEPKAADAAALARDLPKEFPVIGTALEGKLAGKPFTVKKAMLRTNPKGATLEMYAWSEGGPCEPQFAPEPHQLYVSVSFAADQLVAGTPVERPIAIYRKPDLGPIDEDATLVFDSIGTDQVTGRLLLTAPDGTRVAGDFVAAVCASAQKPSAAPTPIHGLTWGTRGVDPTTLPKQPVSGALLGKLGAPVAVEIVDWKADMAEQHEVHFYFTPPKQPCQFDQMSPGFKVGFGTTLNRGLAVNAESSLMVKGAQPWAAVLWEEPGNVVGMEGNGWVSAIIDSHTHDTVEGRVFAWFDDPSKSMIVGAFTAKNCNSKP